MTVMRSSMRKKVGGAVPRAIETSARADQEWLLLLYVLPSKHAHARVQAWRRLQRVGAVSLKNSAYALPQSSESREDFEWIKNEIVAGGGQAIILVARAPEQATYDDVVGAFRAARSRDFEALAIDASKLLKRATSRGANDARRELTQGLRRLRERFDETSRLDFFDTPNRERVAALLARLDQSTGRRRAMESSPTMAVKTADYRGKIWLTRPRPGVDRMSSAWLIQRFIDPDAKFIFADSARTPNAIPFDTFEAEFGHHGTRCTFETLCNRFGITDSAVRRIGRIVHDLDLKETTYGEPETATIGRFVEGLRRAHRDDDALLRSGIDMFEALYQSINAEGPTTPTQRRKPLRSRARGRTRRRPPKQS